MTRRGLWGCLLAGLVAGVAGGLLVSAGMGALFAWLGYRYLPANFSPLRASLVGPSREQLAPKTLTFASSISAMWYQTWDHQASSASGTPG